jgi:hypothetical protein
MEDIVSGLNVGAIAALLIVAAFLAVLVAVIVSERRRVQRDADHLQAMGFTPVEPPPSLVARVGALHVGLANQGIALRRVFHRPIGGGDLYVFDLETSGTGEESADDHGTVAVSSPALDLPRIVLLPRLPVQGVVGGWLSNVAERLIDRTAGRSGLAVFDLSDLPDLDRHYIIMGQDEAAIRRCLTRERVNRLVGMDRRYVISGEGDLFLLSRGTEQRTQPASTEALTVMREDAERLLAWFRSGVMTYL